MLNVLILALGQFVPELGPGWWRIGWYTALTASSLVASSTVHGSWGVIIIRYCYMWFFFVIFLVFQAMAKALQHRTHGCRPSSRTPSTYNLWCCHDESKNICVRVREFANASQRVATTRSQWPSLLSRFADSRILKS